MNKAEEVNNFIGKLYVEPPEEFSDELKNMSVKTRLDLVSDAGNLFSFIRVDENLYYVGLL